MTDKEWLVAYKCCYIEGLCNECPAHNTHNCTSLAEDIFDLINRLDAKREEWSRSATAEKLKNIELQAAFENSVKATKHWHREAELNAKEIIRLQAEIERLKDKYECIYQPIAEVKRTVKSEAIKEFAGKLTDIFYSHDKGDTYVRKVVYNLVKEMAGDDK